MFVFLNCVNTGKTLRKKNTITWYGSISRVLLLHFLKWFFLMGVFYTKYASSYSVNDSTNSYEQDRFLTWRKSFTFIIPEFYFVPFKKNYPKHE
jgi:hypothetical protein